MKIAVYGAGGVGGHFGGLLAVAGAEVHLIARGAHLAALRNNGLSVHSVRGDFVVRLPATSDPADIGPSDYVLFCVKSFDTDTAAAQLEPLVGEDTAVLSLQNGVENEDRLAGVIGYDHVMAGLTFIFLTIEAPGVNVDLPGRCIEVIGDGLVRVHGDLRSGPELPLGVRTLSQSRPREDYAEDHHEGGPPSNTLSSTAILCAHMRSLHCHLLNGRPPCPRGRSS